jgi:protein-L-isoaspartate(D-aspartate) O-methyltransferase
MRPVLVGIAILAGGLTSLEGRSQDFAQARQVMIVEIEANFAVAAPLTGVRRLDSRLAEALSRVPRHRFVPPQLVPHAYADTPLPLGQGQNLTQPYLAALMTQVLEIKPGDKVFETGTDTGYQAAVLAELGARVFSVEVIEPLFAIAKHLLGELGYGEVRLQLADGYLGWAEHGPYDAILVKESTAEVPPALVQQLKPGGRMVLPLGPPEGPQFLTLVVKRDDGRLLMTPLLPVRFAPFQGGTRT